MLNSEFSHPAKGINTQTQNLDHEPAVKVNKNREPFQNQMTSTLARPLGDCLLNTQVSNNLADTSNGSHDALLKSKFALFARVTADIADNSETVNFFLKQDDCLWDYYNHHGAIALTLAKLMVDKDPDGSNRIAIKNVLRP